MNCKQHDDALCVGGPFAGHECHVEAPYGDVTHTSGLVYFHWRVRFNKPMPWGCLENSAAPETGLYPDAWMMPLRGTGALELESDTAPIELGVAHA